MQEITGIFDNGGETMDRYRISFHDGSGVFASEDQTPRGVFMFAPEAGFPKPTANEEIIDWGRLPVSIKTKLRCVFA